MKNALFAAALALLSLGCSFSGQGPYTKGALLVDPSMANYLEEIQASADEIRYATGGVVDLQPRLGQRDGEHASIRAGEPSEGEAGRSMLRQIMVDVADERMADPALRGAVFTHELLHVAGAAGHTSGGLMATAPEHACIDDAALDELCAGLQPGCSPAVRAQFVSTCNR